MFRTSLIILSVYVILVSCSNSEQPSDSNQELKQQKKSNVFFEIYINEDNYRNTLFGESPQISIWVEDVEAKYFKNIYVTQRTWKDDWIGKVHCEVALPYWKSRANIFEIKSQLITDNIEGVSSATSKSNIIKTGFYLDENILWKFFIEANISGDYNVFYKPYLENGIPDTEGNGQPSIVYSGIIDLTKGSVSVPEIIGCTHQTNKIDSLITDLSGLTTAKKIFNKIEIKVL